MNNPVAMSTTTTTNIADSKISFTTKKKKWLFTGLEQEM